MIQPKGDELAGALRHRSEEGIEIDRATPRPFLFAQPAAPFEVGQRIEEEERIPRRLFPQPRGERARQLMLRKPSVETIGDSVAG